MKVRSLEMQPEETQNYCYVLTDDASKKSWVIDPAFPKWVLADVEKLDKSGDIDLAAIVNTHHHWDHSGGNEDFKSVFSNLPIIAGKDSPDVTQTPKHGEQLKLGENLKITALHTPCHTQDSICYFVEDSKTGERAVFTGDTLFVAGCGRFFEGTPEEMNKALNDVLAKLPDDTVVYPGHEYTKSNVKFVKTILPNNEAVNKLAHFCDNNKITTGVFTIGDEKKHNPFMMVSDPAVEEVCGSTDPVKVMEVLRERKNKL
ncbi:putative hydroxyacylglutathione hydrolase [Yarrowia sp. B02]|nr:putative hydroxyacylglutathione hydrolase [Yarrowia sp. B02]